MSREKWEEFEIWSREYFGYTPTGVWWVHCRLELLEKVLRDIGKHPSVILPIQLKWELDRALEGEDDDKPKDPVP